MMDLFWKTEVGSDESEKVNSPNVLYKKKISTSSISITDQRREAKSHILHTHGRQKSVFRHRVRHAFDKSVQSSKVRKIMLAEAVCMIRYVTHETKLTSTKVSFNFAENEVSV